MISRARRDKGIALVTALLIVAVAVIAATAMMTTQNLAVHRGANLQSAEQAWWYGAGVENWIASILEDDRQENEYDHLGEPWAQPVEHLPIEGSVGFMRGRLIDQQGCINVNNLATSPEVTGEQIKRLLKVLESDVDSQALVQSIQDWIDKDSNALPPSGAEDGVYTSYDPPYRTANQPMQSLSELRLVQHMTPQLYQALQPHLCAIPDATWINVNTASAAVLASLAPEMTLQDGEALVQKRAEQDGFPTEADFKKEKVLFGRAIPPNTIGVSTNWFLMVGEIHVGTSRVTLYSLFSRDATGRTRLVAHNKDSF